MFSITIPAEIATKLYNALNGGFGPDIRLYTSDENRRAFLGAAIDVSGFVAIKVTLEGDDLRDKHYVFERGNYYFKEAARANGDVRIVVDNDKKVSIYNCNNLNVNELERCYIIDFESDASPLTKALNNEVRDIATIGLPKKVKDNRAIILDTANHRVGYFKYTIQEPDYSIKEILPLNVISGNVVACFAGQTAHYLPWKKGLAAQIIRYIEKGPLALRFENDGLICLQAALNEEFNIERYKNVFGEENVFDDEIWIEEDDDFLTKGVKK